LGPEDQGDDGTNHERGGKEGNSHAQHSLLQGWSS
jgi:hypothetical protein